MFRKTKGSDGSQGLRAWSGAGVGGGVGRWGGLTSGSLHSLSPQQLHAGPPSAVPFLINICWTNVSAEKKFGNHWCDPISPFYPWEDWGSEKVKTQGHSTKSAESEPEDLSVQIPSLRFTTKNTLMQLYPGDPSGCHYINNLAYAWKWRSVTHH